MLKLNVGFNRKVGEANYGSRGASVNLELELDSGVVEQPSRLKDRVRQLFLLAKASVDDELNGKASALAANGANGQAGERRTSGGRRATASQVRAIHTIADRQGLVLSELLQGRFGLDQPDQLSITEASTLIDELKQAVGNGARR